MGLSRQILDLAKSPEEPWVFTLQILLAVFWQFINKKWVILDELFGDGTGFDDFVASGLVPVLRTKYRDTSSVIAICDPANPRNSFNAETPLDTLRRYGIPANVAYSNKPKLRIEAVHKMLNTNVGGLVVSPNCTMTIAAFINGYKYKETKISGSVSAAYATQPEKNDASHIMDAIQYGVLYIMDGSLADEPRNNNIRAAFKKRVNSMSGSIL